MSARPIPEHGTGARYVRGCRCRPCTTAAGRDDALRILDRIRGNPRHVDSTPALQHLDLFLGRGLSAAQVARAAELPIDTVNWIVRHRPTKIHRRTAAKLLRVPKAHCPDFGYISALGARRRLQALYAKRHSTKDLSARLNLTCQSIALIINGTRPRIDARLHAAIAQLYVELAGQDGTCARNGHRAAREGWMPPDHWDEDELDAPVVEQHLSRIQQATENRKEVLLLADAGALKAEIAARVGLSQARVDEILREDRPVLMRHFKALADTKRGNHNKRSAA